MRVTATARHAGGMGTKARLFGDLCDCDVGQGLSRVGCRAILDARCEPVDPRPHELGLDSVASGDTPST
jgi:hypothetical protein